jgi:osmoprotectant transport system substrate-binding protein
MRINRRLTLGALLLVVTAACNAGGGSTQAPSRGASSGAPSTGPSTATTSQAPGGSTSANLPSIKIGSVGFDEARVMAELYAQVLEANGYTVDRAGIGLGTRGVVAPAIESGQIDLQPEYIGSRISYELTSAQPSGPATSASVSYPPSAPASGGITGPTGDSATNFSNLQTLLAPKNLTVFNYTPAVDTNAFVVRADTASQFNLTKVSDTTQYQTQLKWGLASDCPTNPLCGKPGGALEQYGITQQTVAGATLLSACDTPMAEALKTGTIDVAELCSTQPDIAVNGWVLLEDDKQTQPADNVSPIVRNDYLDKVDQSSFEKLLNDVSAKIDTATLTDLYKQVAVDHKDPKDVAATWLKTNGFVK